MKKILYALGIFLLIAGFEQVFAGGNQEDSPVASENSAEQKIRITDYLGREIVLDRPAETFIGIMPSIPELLKVLGCEDGIIGRDCWTTDTTFYSNLEDIPVINGDGSGGFLDYEKIVELDPDLFIIMKNAAFDPTQAIENLHPAIPVVVLETDDIETMGKNIRKLGILTGKEEIAERLANFNDEIYKQITERSASLDESDKPEFFFKISGWSKEQLCTMTDESTMVKKQIVNSGGCNIAGELEGIWIQDLDPEWLMTKDYDVLFSMVWEQLYPGIFGYDVKDLSVAENLYNETCAMDVLKGSSAVKNKRIYLYDSRICTSPRSIITMAYIAKWLHPELYEDLDPKELHQRYLDEFLKVDIDLDKQGLFFYPDIK